MPITDGGSEARGRTGQLNCDSNRALGPPSNVVAALDVRLPLPGDLRSGSLKLLPCNQVNEKYTANDTKIMTFVSLVIEDDNVVILLHVLY